MLCIGVHLWRLDTPAIDRHPITNVNTKEFGICMGQRVDLLDQFLVVLQNPNGFVIR